MIFSGTPQVITSIGGRTVLTSGIVHVEGDQPINVQISNLFFVFKFAKDDGGSRYVGEAKEGELILTLYNHSNSLGEGFLSPISVANLDGKQLSLTYFVNTLDNLRGARRFEYVFYLGAE
jgi:hypothetical protein